MKYRIELEEDQLVIIAECLELVSRIQCGQLDVRTISPLEFEIGKSCSKMSHSDYHEMVRMVNGHLSEIKKIIWTDIDPHAHYGIGYSPKSDHLYEMYKKILYTLEMIDKEKKESEGKDYLGNVHSNKPMSYTDNPKIEVYPLTIDIKRDENIDEILSNN